MPREELETTSATQRDFKKGLRTQLYQLFASGPLSPPYTDISTSFYILLYGSSQPLAPTAAIATGEQDRL